MVGPIVGLVVVAVGADDGNPTGERESVGAAGPAAEPGSVGGPEPGEPAAADDAEPAAGADFAAEAGPVGEAELPGWLPAAADGLPSPAGGSERALTTGRFLQALNPHAAIIATATIPALVRRSAGRCETSGDASCGFIAAESSRSVDIRRPATIARRFGVNVDRCKMAHQAKPGFGFCAPSTTLRNHSARQHATTQHLPGTLGSRPNTTFTTAPSGAHEPDGCRRHSRSSNTRPPPVPARSLWSSVPGIFWRTTRAASLA
ncbi:hypothetical protein ACFPIJ_42945 [Dactylosporangium cerinum]|uniref:Uncharacterized protein n=1 Tax=Dactylosporangium cerinum TaxID=1434730 RepID=A0ABV9W7B4_9ACTN